jgi:hypothetical protein
VIGIVIIISAYALVNTLIGENSSSTSSGSDSGNVSVGVGDNTIDVGW